jgi:hypothetical protein
VSGTKANTQGVLAPVGFPIKLAASLDENHVVFVEGGGENQNPDPVHCAGSAAEPEAAGGYLCVYALASIGVPFPAFILQLDGGTPGASPAGAFLAFEAPTSDSAQAFGSWAVTG